MISIQAPQSTSTSSTADCSSKLKDLRVSDDAEIICGVRAATPAQVEEFCRAIPMRYLVTVNAMLAEFVWEHERDNKPLDWSEITEEIRRKMAEIGIKITPNSFLDRYLVPEKMEVLYKYLEQFHSEDIKLIGVHRDYIKSPTSKKLSLVLTFRQQRFVRKENGVGCREAFAKALKEMNYVVAGLSPQSKMAEIVESLNPILVRFSETIKNEPFPDVEREFIPNFRSTYARFGFPFPVDLGAEFAVYEKPFELPLTPMETESPVEANKPAETLPQEQPKETVQKRPLAVAIVQQNKPPVKPTRAATRKTSISIPQQTPVEPTNLAIQAPMVAPVAQPNTVPLEAPSTSKPAPPSKEPSVPKTTRAAATKAQPKPVATVKPISQSPSKPRSPAVTTPHVIATRTSISPNVTPKTPAPGLTVFEPKTPSTTMTTSVIKAPSPPKELPKPKESVEEKKVTEVSSSRESKVDSEKPVEEGPTTKKQKTEKGTAAKKGVKKPAQKAEEQKKEASVPPEPEATVEELKKEPETPSLPESVLRTVSAHLKEEKAILAKDDWIQAITAYLLTAKETGILDVEVFRHSVFSQVGDKIYSAQIIKESNLGSYAQKLLDFLDGKANAMDIDPWIGQLIIAVNASAFNESHSTVAQQSEQLRVFLQEARECFANYTPVAAPAKPSTFFSTSKPIPERPALPARTPLKESVEPPWIQSRQGSKCAVSEEPADSTSSQKTIDSRVTSRRKKAA